MPPVSPFGFDFFTHTNFEWQPAPSAAPSPKPQLAQPKEAPTAGWACRACTFVNSGDNDKCEICGEDRHAHMEDDNHKHEAKSDEAEEDNTWACEACSFRNRPEAEQCEVCETKRGAKFKSGETGDGMEGEGVSREGKQDDVDGDEKEGSDLSSISSLSSSSTSSGGSSSDSMTGGSGSQLPGVWTCSYCSWLNPPTAVLCEVCEREGKRSGMAQLVKLEMARKHEQSRAATDSTQTAARSAWSCHICTFVNRKQASQTLNPPLTHSIRHTNDLS